MPAVQVPVETIDRVVASRRPDRLGFVKIDAEGFEPDALAGGAGTTERCRPVVCMGFNAWTLMGFLHRNLVERGCVDGVVLCHGERRNPACRKHHAAASLLLKRRR